MLARDLFDLVEIETERVRHTKKGGDMRMRERPENGSIRFEIEERVWEREGDTKGEKIMRDRQQAWLGFSRKRE
jgi:hypothetical protein